jgi:hypothetical protein
VPDPEDPEVNKHVEIAVMADREVEYTVVLVTLGLGVCMCPTMTHAMC